MATLREWIEIVRKMMEGDVYPFEPAPSVTAPETEPTDEEMVQSVGKIAHHGDDPTDYVVVGVNSGKHLYVLGPAKYPVSTMPQDYKFTARPKDVWFTGDNIKVAPTKGKLVPYRTRSKFVVWK